MELKLTIYEDKYCRKPVKEVAANDFDLSLAVCEDLLDIINIDMFDGGLDALTDKNNVSVYLPIVKNALPFVKDLLAGLFEVSVDELKYTKIMDIVNIVKHIIAFAINGLPKDNSKN